MVDSPKLLAGAFVDSRSIDRLYDGWHRGIVMARLPLLVMGGTLAGAIVFAFVVDIVKVPTFARLKIT